MSAPVIHHASFYPIIGTTSEEAHGPDINVWIIVITALIFYSVLSWYNFFLATYNYMVRNNSENKENPDPDNLRIMGLTFGFAFFWTLLAIGLYILFRNQGMLSYPILDKVRGHLSEREKTRGGGRPEFKDNWDFELSSGDNLLKPL